MNSLLNMICESLNVLLLVHNFVQRVQFSYSFLVHLGLYDLILTYAVHEPQLSSSSPIFNGG